MSTINVNQVLNSAGELILTNAGSIIQVANINSLGQAVDGNISTTSTTYVTTGFSLSFTPKRADSILNISLCFNSKFLSGTGDDGAGWKLYRDDAVIDSNNGYDMVIYRGDANTNNHHTHCSIIHSIPANNTNTSIFDLRFVNGWGGIAYYITNSGTNTMTIMEIAN